MKKGPRQFGGPGNEYINALDKLYSNRPRNDIHTIKASITLHDFYQSELPAMPPTNRDGWVEGGLCPFHADKRAGSFRVNLDTGAFKCFSCGTSGGDIIAFLQVRDGLSFPEALKRISSDWGLT
jgi:DNA primase